MNYYIIYAAIALVTILVSTLFGYLIPMMYREKKFRTFWDKCPECENKKTKNELYSPISFWKYGGYCKKHAVKPYKNILFTLFFTVASMLPLVLEHIFTGNPFSADSIVASVVAMLLVYATLTDFKGLVIPDFCNIAIFCIGIATMFHSAFAEANPVYWERIIGMVCISLPLFLTCLLGKSGFGDVKLFAALGILLGWKNLLLVLLVATITGLIYAFFKKITAKNLKWKSEVPFGPFICLGTYLSLTAGEELITAYMRLFQ